MDIWNKTYNITEIGRRAEISALSLGFQPLIQNLLSKTEGCLHNLTLEGYVKDDDKNGDTYIDFIKGLGGRVIYQSVPSLKDQPSPKSIVALWEHGVVEISINGEPSMYANITGISYKTDFLSSIQEHFSSLFISPVKQGHIFAIVNQNNRLSLSSLGDAGIPLVVDNYMPDVLEGYNKIVADLQAETPTGRISILEGSPGSGKSHIIRSLLTEVSDAMFILVNPDMVSSLSGPELLPLLLAQKNSYQLTGPIILILEDADRCLVHRQSDNMGSIQNLLNLSDGILGSLLDIRIVATTNAKKLEMEPAILRPGRLSQRIEVGSLSIEHAIKVFKKLLPEATLPEKFSHNKTRDITLAEVYLLAKKAGWKTPSRKEKAPIIHAELPDFY